jgi:tripeptide aminopeptidase
MQAFAPYPSVLVSAASFGERRQELIDLCIQVQQIPAPTDAEAVRAAWVEQQFLRLGLLDVAVDASHNVYARWPGRLAKPALLVSAHTDTVFPAETNLAVRVDVAADRIYGPGIGDNSLGVAGLLLLAKTLAGLPMPPVDIWLVANTGEEGLGDLRGMRAAVDRLHAKLGASIVIEGMGLRRVIHQALGSRRFRIAVAAPGGHSWSDFGAASAVHVLAQLAADLTRLSVPASPRTTFNIGRLNGGTSVNTIAQQASLELDLRSEDARVLEAVVSQALEMVARYQTVHWQQQNVQVQVEKIGDRAAGQIGDEHPLVQAAFATLQASGLSIKTDLRISSTDANIPLSRGLPAICIGLTEGGNAHRLEEWITPSLLPQGMAHLLLTTWWAAMWLAGEVS